MDNTYGLSIFHKLVFVGFYQVGDLSDAAFMILS